MLFSSRRLIAHIALFAMLFSAISPALAALRFYGNAEVLANIVSVASAARSVGEHQHSSHASSRAHKVYCTFCLDMTSVQALTMTVPDLPAYQVATDIPPFRLDTESASSYPPQYPRAPPVISV